MTRKTSKMTISKQTLRYPEQRPDLVRSDEAGYGAVNRDGEPARLLVYYREGGEVGLRIAFLLVQPFNLGLTGFHKGRRLTM